MVFNPSWRWLVAASMPLALGAYQAQGRSADKVDFDRQVLGVFKAYCITCHEGGDQAAGGLDLTSAKGIEKGGKSGALIVAGKPEQSLLIHRVKGMHGMPRMPKGFAPLSATQIEGLEKWIAAGGSTRSSGSRHWAYATPVRPTLPKGLIGWGNNPIDRFVGERLRKEGLKPSAQASREKLLRRVSLDIIGLPPTEEELDRYLSDKSPNAYEKAVDRLLSSPHYGERQARVWLDLARYADTNGYEADRSRQAHLYRDWVIDAFNSNMPYDRFSIEQLAGDLIPGARVDQRIATGFHRNAMFNEEGGVDAEESMFETILDRVGTTSTVWMGSTVSCARCHDHKFDPFTQKDFYQMYAFFSNNQYEAVGDVKVGQRKFYEPTLKVPSGEQQKRIAQLKNQLKSDTAKLKSPVVDGKFEAWLKATPLPVQWEVVVPSEAKSEGGATLSIAPDGVVSVAGKNPEKDTYRLSGTVKGVVTGVKIEPLPDPKMVGGGPGRSESGNFVLTAVGLNLGSRSVETQLGVASVDFVQNGYDPLVLLGPQSSPRDGAWAVFPDAKTPHRLIIEPASSLLANTLRLSLEFQSVWKSHTFSKFRVSVTSSPNPALSDLPPAIAALKSKTPRTAVETSALRDFFERSNAATALHRFAAQEVQRELIAVEASVASALVMVEKPAKGPLTAPVHRRGEFLNKGDLVEAATPEFLPPRKNGNRLDFAKWLFSKEHPLTARVQVNRLWAQFFGRGLVETEEDFGTQGAPPSHPELLDWLACDLRDSGWDVKRSIKTIVLSATYRQGSVASPKLRERDPHNVLLARGPRFRMEAEMIRDTALRASGLLNPEVGGRSVMPYQPEGIWDSPYSGEMWTVATGKDRFRRGLYIYWKRTAPYPSFMAFDASSRETCTVRRVRTNTPLQALALLNDQAYLEAAHALAKATAGAKTDAARIKSIFRRCTGRLPDAAEAGRMTRLLATLLQRYRANPKEAGVLLGKTAAKPSPAEAAWVMVSSVVLNLDETITRD